MLAIRKLNPTPGLDLQEVAEPGPPQAGEVLIEVAAAGVCGSDVHVYAWTGGYDFMRARMPVTLGHEFCGRIAAVGAGVTGFSEGDLVAPMPSASCMKCVDCAGGRVMRCKFKRTLGLTTDGGFARLVRAPAISCIPLPSGTDPVIAALMEPLSVGDNAVDVGEVRFGDVVLVLGPGTIGQAIARGASWRGADVVVVAGLDDAPRLQTARQVGADHTLDLASCGPLADAVLAVTGGRSPDVVFEATGHPSSINAGLEVLRPEGIFVTAGIHAAPANFDVTAFVRKRQQLRAAHSSRRENWDRMARRVTQSPDDVRPFVSVSLGLTDALEAFGRAASRQVSKVILRPDAG